MHERARCRTASSSSEQDCRIYGVSFFFSGHSYQPTERDLNGGLASLQSVEEDSWKVRRVFILLAICWPLLDFSEDGCECQLMAIHGAYSRT
jgi:hypothetical protein